MPRCREFRCCRRHVRVYFRRRDDHYMMRTQAPWLHAMTLLAYVVHVGGGAVGLVSGAIAVIARKGGRLHRRAGTVFVVSMVVMAVFACYLAIAIPDQLVNVFISVFFPKRGAVQRPRPHRDLWLYVRARDRSDWRPQARNGRGPFGGIAHFPPPLAHVPRANIGCRFGLHQRIGAASSRPLPCADRVLLSPVHPTGSADLLADSRAVHGLVQAPGG